MSRIVVKNLPGSGINEIELKKHFGDIDKVTDVKLKYNDLGVFRRFAFVGFRCEESAEKAIDLLNNSYIKNSKIIIEPCKAIKDIKPDRVSKKNKSDDAAEADREPSEKKSKKLINNENVFDEVKDDPQFQEFLQLQRNIGDNSKTNQIWQDDVLMNDESVKVDFNDIEDDEQHETNYKRHKRSRGATKKAASASKAQPKELFVHTVKVSGIPDNAKRKDVKEFFKPLELLSIRINKRDGICYVSFKDDRDLRFALKKNMHFWHTSRVKILRHNVHNSRVFKEKTETKVREKQISFQKYEQSMQEVEPVEETGRLFVRNLNYSCNEQDLEQVFSKYGTLTEIHLPIDRKTTLPKGYAYIEFMFPKDALKAYEELNGTIFQGRNFHLIPSKPKPEGSHAGQIGPVIRNAVQSRPAKSNTLFLGQNALADAVSDMKQMDKEKLLTEQNRKDPIAVRLALGDAVVVDEVRNFLSENGLDNETGPRSRRVMIAKNLPTSMTKEELTAMFERHGTVSRVVMAPKGMTAIIEMDEPVQAKIAFKRLAYAKIKDTVLYLEWAPLKRSDDEDTGNRTDVGNPMSTEDQEHNDLDKLKSTQTGTKILVKNIPFECTVAELRKIFATFGELKFVRIPKKLDGQHRGFGFVDYLSQSDALRAFQALCHSTHLYGRRLVLEWAKPDQ